MIKTGACKRCGGDLAWERDRYGSYMSCIQCGTEATGYAGGMATSQEISYAEETVGHGSRSDQLAVAVSR